MNAFNTSWIGALSMTLLHSLWQGMAITLLTAFILKVFGIRNSSSKYIIKTGAFFALFVSIVITFFVVLQPGKEIAANTIISGYLTQTPVITIENNSYLNTVTDYLQTHQLWIVLGWAMGTFLFSLRFVAGIAYLKYLRLKAIPADDSWSNSLKDLSAKLGIDRIVQLYESIQVQTPIAMGYLKPVILMPIGLMAGLSAQQVEVILIHELEHIRRHDYLINFIQSLGETILFFNPFVWILSAWIRNERENCCDDAVLREGYDPKLYATTLYELESARLQHAGLALALTGNKNQLLNRIKRIMEHSAKNQKGKEKFIPLVLVVLGLVFASWLSINPKEVAEVAAKQIAASDTLINPKTKTETYSRKSVITYDVNGKPHEEVIETYSGDGDDEFDFGFDMPDAPDAPDMSAFNFNLDPAFATMPDMVPDFAFDFDTLPEFQHFTITLNDERMSQYEITLKNEMKEKFGDFYAKNGEKLEKIMTEIHEKMARMDEQRTHFAPIPAIPLHEMEEAKLAQLQAMEEMKLAELNRKISEDQMLRNEEVMKIHEEEMRRHEADMKVMETKLQKFEKELTEMLIQDGYLKKGQTMQGVNFNFTDEGISINGQKIKAADEPKYRKLNHKYFGESVRHRPE